MSSVWPLDQAKLDMVQEQDGLASEAYSGANSQSCEGGPDAPCISPRTEEGGPLLNAFGSFFSEQPAEEDAPAPPEEADNAKVAAGKAIAILGRFEKDSYCGLETRSMYGVAVAMPQIARSTNWSGTLTAMALRSYFFLFCNICLQAFLLSMVGMEQLVMYPFAGRMHLCDFGADVAACTVDAANEGCRGPVGSTVTYPRLYSFNTWQTRVFVKDTLKTLFPERIQEIEANVDPGEYGIENNWCRMVCVTLFMISVVDDIMGTWRLAFTLYAVPTRGEPWISYEVPQGMGREDAKKKLDMCELDFVKFRVAGMPLGWKVVNVLFVLIPKLMIWLALVLSGVHYLMETADIVDVVVNAMALNFILQVDEMMFSRVSTLITQHIMSHLEDLPLFDTADLEAEPSSDTLERLQREELGPARLQKLIYTAPKVLMLTILMQILFVAFYYVKNCSMTSGDGWVSQPLYLPEISEVGYNLLGLMFGVPPAGVSEPIWTMPEPERGGG